MTLTASVIIVWLLIGLVIGGLARLLARALAHLRSKLLDPSEASDASSSALIPAAG